ncbi:MAG: HD domain-containing protein [Lachnospiraceae bacterium]|nr:HD domain-containing protein [Lachnospiraceae bacterium]
MIDCKLQIFCLIMTVYITYLYWRNQNGREKKRHTKVFEAILGVSVVYYFTDIITVYMVNRLNMVPPLLNRGMHLVFLCCIVTILYLLFEYVLAVCQVHFPNKWLRILTVVPYVGGVVLATVSIGRLYYVEGEYTNYSMGIPVYVCYGVGIIYLLVAFFLFMRYWNHIEKRKAVLLRLYFMVLIIGIGIQAVFPETLITSAIVFSMILGLYAHMENHEVEDMGKMYEDTIHSVADIVESRDGSTGEHIKRTTIYVKIIAEELRKDKKYANIITKDYINSLVLAAPLHDVGKVAIPDSILQKPGKLTDEEFDEMKKHTTKGAEIIQKSFFRNNTRMTTQMMEDVALYHHEKWNGYGYPQRLSGEEIPLAARIMAVADVFDAVSQKRCYRDAMSLDESFAIIEEGRGNHFDPDVADSFLRARRRVEKAYGSLA